MMAFVDATINKKRKLKGNRSFMDVMNEIIYRLDHPVQGERGARGLPGPSGPRGLPIIVPQGGIRS